MSEFDAEKMAREIAQKLSVIEITIPESRSIDDVVRFSSERDGPSERETIHVQPWLIESILSACMEDILTTARNTGLERAAETCAERAEFYRLCSQAEGVDPDLAMQREYAAEALETLTILIKEQSIPKKVHP